MNAAELAKLRASVCGEFGTPATLDYVPLPKQQVLHDSDASLILFGGSVGGSKSHALRMDAVGFCMRNAGLQAFLFRRTRRELENTHVRRLSDLLIPSGIARLTNRTTFEFSNGSFFQMCYCDTDRDRYSYQSEEIGWLGIDESGHFPPDWIGYLEHRLRIGNAPDSWPDRYRLPRFVLAANPGDVGHLYNRAIVKGGPAGEVWRDDQGRKCLFLPSKLSDNPYLPADYGKTQFGHLPPELVRAYLDGDWDAVVGSALHNLSVDRHRIGKFKPPAHWMRVCSMDWGVRRPTAVLWAAVADDDTWLAEAGRTARLLPRGALVVYREYYGSNGRHNEGNGWPPARVAQEVKMLEFGDRAPDVRVADTQIWSAIGGPTVAEQFAAAGVYWAKAKKDRASNYAEVLGRLAGDGEFDATGVFTDRPALFISSECVNTWRTLPSLVLDNVSPDRGPSDRNADDHCWDSLAYLCRSRPWVMEAADYDRMLEEEERASEGAVAAVPYERASRVH